MGNSDRGRGTPNSKIEKRRKNNLLGARYICRRLEAHDLITCESKVAVPLES